MVKGVATFSTACGYPPHEGCPRACGQRRVCRLYHCLMVPTTAARAASDAISLFTGELLGLGTDGN